LATCFAHAFEAWPSQDWQRIMPPCQSAAKTKLQMFRCPSDTSVGITSKFHLNGTQYYTGNQVPTGTDTSREPTPAAGTNYVACNGSGTGYYYDSTYITDGVFHGIRKTTSMNSVTDGTSNTVMFSETIIGDYSFNESAPDERKPYSRCSYHDLSKLKYIGQFKDPPNNGFSGLAEDSAGTTNPIYADESLNIETVISTYGTGWYGYRGCAWISAKANATGFTTFSKPNPPHPDFGVMQGGAGFYAARSHHVSGVNAGYVDGTVHFINNDVDRKNWQRLGSMNDEGRDLP
jgi:hypothetical protein